MSVSGYQQEIKKYVKFSKCFNCIVSIRVPLHGRITDMLNCYTRFGKVFVVTSEIKKVSGSNDCITNHSKKYYLETVTTYFMDCYCISQ